MIWKQIVEDAQQMIAEDRKEIARLTRHIYALQKSIKWFQECEDKGTPWPIAQDKSAKVQP